jgi:hypothetical protein
VIEFVLAKRASRRREQVWEMRERLWRAFTMARWTDGAWYCRAIDDLERAAKIWD